MSESKRCPFCGGVYKEVWDHPANCYLRMVLDDIEMGEQGYIAGYHTEQELDEAWNTRYEQTCTMDEGSWGPDGVYAASDYICSNCERVVWINGELNYCPNCGARVVSE